MGAEERKPVPAGAGPRHRRHPQHRDPGRLAVLSLAPPSHFLSRWLFLRLLGLTYLIAFVSLWLQVEGLIGDNGILPAGEWLDAVARQLGIERYRLFPTLCWLFPGEGVLHALCGAGVVLSCALMIGIAPLPCLVLLWAFYLSLTTVSGVFLGYQWDILLLETGLLAIFLAPARLLPGISREAAPSPVALWLLRWLLFRLMFASGVVKLSSGDETWRDLTALSYHYETQPLPTWTSWYVHQLPEWFQSVSVVLMLVVELGAPFLVLAPWRWRWLRYAGAAALAGLQLMILATGNYGFFNLLSLALCVLLLDDGIWPARWQDKLPASRNGTGAWLRGWPGPAVLPLAAVVLLLSLMLVPGTLRKPVSWPGALQEFYGWVSPFHLVNGYGLFSVMTTSRPEIIVEGSNDGQVWEAYEFKWKPGDLDRRPRFVAPHMPRLDWQMWFAALGDYRSGRNRWFQSFLLRLLEGSPEVLGLLEHNPFPEAPPRYLRAVVYEYRFTDFDSGRDGAWWRRERKGLYCPIASLQPR